MTVVETLQSEARSAEARPTGRRTKCAPAERSRKAAGVSGINPGTKCRGKADRPSHEVRPSGAQPKAANSRERYKLSFHPNPDRTRHAGAGQAAIAGRVLAQVLLVVGLGKVELGGFANFGGDRPVAPGVQGFLIGSL